ncbi:MAG: glycolate oxidase subunit GlcE [Pseudomonadota bacterium]
MTPTTEDELAEAVATASDAAVPLHIRGGGTRSGLGHAVTGDILETAALTGMTLYDPGALTLVARAGTPMAEIENALEAENQKLPFEPMDHRALYGSNGTPTIGGVVAANVSGPRRIQAGACRDSLIGVRFVDGRGTAIKNGGRVMKNVTGYDLVKLMAGSHGTLGVLSEVSFKLLPSAEATATVRAYALQTSDGVAALSAALGSPYDVTGAAFTPDGDAVVRVEGFEGSVRYRAAQLREMFGRFGDVSVHSDPAETASLWADIRDAKAIATGPGDVWRVSVKPTDGPRVVDAVGQPGATLLDWGGGLVWARVAEGHDLRHDLRGIPGHATLVRGSEETKTKLRVFEPEPEPLSRMSRGLRAQFDPKGILNPGRMG